MMPFFLSLLSIFLISCSGPGDMIGSAFKNMGMSGSKVWLEHVSFRASDDMNDQTPVTVHIVVVYDAALLADIVKLDASSYFEKIDQMKIDNAGKIDVFPFDLIRGQRLNDQTISPSKMSGEGVVIFARYSNSGPHRAVLSDEAAIIVDLGREDFRISPVKN